MYDIQQSSCRWISDSVGDGQGLVSDGSNINLYARVVAGL